MSNITLRLHYQTFAEYGKCRSFTTAATTTNYVLTVEKLPSPITFPKMKSLGVLLVGGADAGILGLALIELLLLPLLLLLLLLLLLEAGGTTVDPIQHDFFTVSFSVIGDSGAIRMTGTIFCEQT
jgi:hypothetical protein